MQQRPPNVFKFFAHVAPLAGLAALGLAAAPVGAQTTSLTLNSGDSVAVSSAGTVGTQNGAAVVNGTTSYDDSDGYGLANSGYGYAVQANGTASFALGTGGTLTSGDNSVTLDVEGSGPVSVTGGTVTGGGSSDGIYAGGSSPVSISGGTLTTGDNSLGVYADGGPVSISGGTISAGNGFGSFGVYTDAASPVTISGSTVITAGQSGDGVYASSSGPVTISGGEIVGGVYGVGLFADAGSNTLITGGTITSGGPLVTQTLFGVPFTSRGPGDGVLAYGGVVTITGGSISGGGSGNGLIASNSGIINLFSQGDSDFYINGVAINNTSLTDYRTGTLTGTLLDGESLDTPFVDGGTFNFNVGDPPASAAPEPSAVAVWALVGLGAAGLALKARKRNATTT